MQHRIVERDGDRVKCQVCGWHIGKKSKGVRRCRIVQDAHRLWRVMNPDRTSCDICGATENLEVDHDHRCCPGTRGCGSCIRGLLCRRCNGHIAVVENRLPELLAYLG